MNYLLGCWNIPVYIKYMQRNCEGIKLPALDILFVGEALENYQPINQLEYE